MIKHVSFQGTTFAELPFKFEAGTPDFVGIAAVTEAIAFLESEDFEGAEAYELTLLRHAERRLREEIKDIRIFGEASHKSAILSFMLGDVHPYDVGMLLDGFGIAVRTGHHCAQPLMERLGIPGTIRAGFVCYNTEEEVDRFIEAMKRVAKMLKIQ